MKRYAVVQFQHGKKEETAAIVVKLRIKRNGKIVSVRAMDKKAGTVENATQTVNALNDDLRVKKTRKPSGPQAA
jgi:hypothetical protein